MYPINASDGNAPGIIQSLMPLLIIGIILGAVIMRIAIRKGRNKWFWFAMAFVPLVNIFGTFYLVSLIDISIRKEIDVMKKDLKELKLAFMSHPQISWNCTCGKLYGMEVQNCPECGLKRDYILKNM